MKIQTSSPLASVITGGKNASNKGFRKSNLDQP
jgi:hypothetical protein